MNGIRDQIVALEWVAQHIARFGGDPARVTINGQSAGGESTCILMVSPLAHGLFSQMMAQSGECLGPWGPQNQTQGFESSAALMKSLGVSTLAGLKELPPERIVTAGGSFYAVDGHVMPSMPVERWAGKEPAFNTKRMMLGSVSIDAMQGPGPTLWPLFSMNLTGTPPPVLMGESFGPNFAAVEEQYPLSRFDGASVLAVARPDSDWDVGCPMVGMADLLTAAGGEAYFYVFGCGSGFCSHGYELPFVFGNGAVAGFPGPQVPTLTGPYDPKFADLTMELWAAFVRTGNPTPPGTVGPAWPRFSTEWWGEKPSGAGVPGMYLGGGKAVPHGAPAAPVGAMTPADCKFWQTYNPFAR
eukprot:COSAG04_NODE_17_length_40288_cov_9.152728_17_plen_356_part_00